MNDYSLIEQKVPEFETFIGTSDIDAKEIEQRFPGAYRAVDLVNEFDASLLVNVAYIYNTNDEAAFGVFNPSLNDTINWIRVKEQLEKEGFQTNIKGNIGPEDKLFAYSPNVPSEQIESRMEAIFREKSSTGGVAIGIDAQRILSAAENMVSSGNNVGLTVQQKDDLKIAQLASIIAHEAVHSKGAKDEVGPEKVQDAVLNYAINKFNIPVQTVGQKIHADTNGWYAKAQIVPFNSKLIEVILRSVQERDSQSFPLKIERNDSIEKIFENNCHLNDKEGSVEENIMENNLSKDHKNDDKQGTVEKQLQENRPHALILPIRASSNNLLKEASWRSNLGGPFVGGLFGHMNGMNDGWTEPFEADEIDDNYSSIRSSGSGDNSEMYWRRRYNPMFARGKVAVDRMGHPYFNYDFQCDFASMEMRNRPTMFWDRQNYWPSRSDIAVMGSSDKKDENIKNNFVIHILRKIGYYKSLLKNGKRMNVRIVLDENALPHVLEAISDYSYFLFDKGKKYVIWLSPNSNEEDILKIENDINNGQNVKEINDFVCLSDRVKENLNKIFSKCKLLCRLNGIHNVFAVGGFVRTLASTKDYCEINDLDFTGIKPDDCLKLGGLLASDFGIYEIGYYHRTKTISFEVDGIKMDFRGNFVPFDVRPLLRENNIETTPLNFDIYARDFTVNSLIYDFNKNKIYDVSGRGLPDLEKRVIKTFFDPDIIIPLNPIIVTRAISLNLKGFTIDADLDNSMIKNSQEIFNGKLSEDRLAYEYEKIANAGEDGTYLLEQYGLSKLKEIRDKVANENPDMFLKS